MLPALIKVIGFLPTLFTGIKEFVGKKQDLQRIERTAEVELKKAKVEAEIKRMQSSDQADMILDRESLEQTGWKDEYLLILTTFPVIVLFLSPFVDLGYTIFYTPSESIPNATTATGVGFVYTQGLLANAVADGFDAMSKAPTEYWYALCAVYIHSLGMRRMVRLAIDKLIASKINPFAK